MLFSVLAFLVVFLLLVTYWVAFDPEFDLRGIDVRSDGVKDERMVRMKEDETRRRKMMKENERRRKKMSPRQVIYP